MVPSRARIRLGIGGIALLAAVTAGADEPAVDVAPEVLQPVRDRTYSVRDAERDAYYTVLEHARSVDDQKVRTRAREFRLERIRETARPEAAEALLERPEQFPVFVDLFRNPAAYRGKPVTLRGHVRRLVSYPAGENDVGLDTLYEAWVFTEDSQSNPAVVVCSEIPEGMPQGDQLNERVSVSGYFFKMYGYEARDTTRVAPLILAVRLQWHPAVEKAAWRPSATEYIILAAAVLGLTIVVWRLARTDRGAGRRAIGHESDSEGPDFRELDRTGP